jgi:two-component system sensor histidine kinase TctE
VIAAVVGWVVQRATRPVRELSATIQARADDDLSPIAAPQLPRELMPLVEATNGALARQASLLAHQQRFVRDASHQLRTPLAVLKTQVQSAQRGDLPAQQALVEIGQTVDGAVRLANQMLALAKVEQLRQQGDPPVLDWAETVREVALDLAPLIADRGLDFELDTVPARVRGHAWALRELTRNLLHNALKHCPEGGRLALRLVNDGRHAALTVADSGPGIPAELRPRLLLPFASGGEPGTGAGDGRHGGSAGLGLAICQQIVASLGGSLSLDNRLQAGRIRGLDATVRLALADNPAP